jgi:pimeloyl-ACP methyl ester carboxylesterase
MSTNPQEGSQPTVVLVHGAFAESASWNGVIRRLHEQGYTALAAANPIRSLSGDAEFVASILESIQGPVVLVGHSYGGAVISNAALGKDNVEALVFVGAFAPEEGESIGDLAGRFPGSTLGDTLTTVPLADGSTDLYIRQEEYHEQFAADAPAEQAALDAVTQRPLRDVALNEGSGPPGWKSIPSWFVFGELDKNIPLEMHRFMAERAEAREVVEIEGAPHAVGVSHPEEVAEVILRAIKAVE